MKAISLQELENWLTSLKSKYDVLIPISIHDGTRSFGRIGEGNSAIVGGTMPVKPTSIFFPQFDHVLSYADDKIVMQKPLSKPLLAVGFTAADVECLDFIDRFYSTNYYDDIYFNRRNCSVVMAVTGRCDINGEFMRIAGGKCDIELVYDGENFIVVPYSETGISLAKNIKGGIDNVSLDKLQKESDSLPNDDHEILMQASKLLQEDKVPDEFWEDLAKRCIACTACNLSCPTCTCFEVYDLGGKRIRMWDSCQLDGFMREASGHNPMSKESTRVRRRIHHKIAADVTRWNTVSCFLCGRCDTVCPVDLGIKTITREMVKKYGE